MDKCLIEKEDIRVAIDEICKFLTKHQVIAYNPKVKDGVLRHIVARSSKLTQEIQVTLILTKELPTIKIKRPIINVIIVRLYHFL